MTLAKHPITEREAEDVEDRSTPRTPIIYEVVHDIGNAMRLVACFTMWSMSILPSIAQTDVQAPSDPQAYCVNRNADFYLYTGEPCQSGYQLGAGNCRKPDGRVIAVPKEQCAAMAGTIELPFEGGRPPQAPKPMK